jgi:uncharacterized protein (TIGR02594 family)
MPKKTGPLLGDPPWLKAAYGDLGLWEQAGPLTNPRIVEMYRAANHPAPETLDDTTWSWCSAAECLWFEESFLASTNSLMGRSWLKRKNSTRLDIDKPLPRGAVVVLKYDNNPAHGHVANLIEDNGTTIRVIGANQSNHVCEMSWKRSALVGAIWPNEVPMPGAKPVPVPKPKPAQLAEQDPEEDPDEMSAQRRQQPDDPGVDEDEAPKKAPWYRRLWLRWFGGTGASYLGLAGLTDWQIAAVLIGSGILAIALAVGAVLKFIGEDGRAVVREWIVRQFRD